MILCETSEEIVIILLLNDITWEIKKCSVAISPVVLTKMDVKEDKWFLRVYICLWMLFTSQ